MSSNGQGHDIDHPHILTDPESLIVAMERVTVLFDRFVHYTDTVIIIIAWFTQKINFKIP